MKIKILISLIILFFLINTSIAEEWRDTTFNEELLSSQWQIEGYYTGWMGFAFDSIATMDIFDPQYAYLYSLGSYIELAARESAGDRAYCSVKKDIYLGEVNNLIINYQQDNNDQIYVYVDSNQEYLHTHNFVKNDIVINVSGYTGTHEVQIIGSNLIFQPISGPKIYYVNLTGTPPSTKISWYPNNENTNESYVYDVKIENLEPPTVYYYAYYKSTWLEDSEEWTPYTHQLFGFVDDYELCPGTGRCTIGFFQENTDGIYNYISTNYWSNDYYKIVKWDIRLMYLNMSVISTDTIIYDANDSWVPPNETIPDIPEPEPTPTPTYTPLPWPTPTEIPTPIPTPGTENYTINTSQMGDYYSSVNDSMGALNDSISGSTNFLLIPVLGFTSYINTINTSLVESINQSTGHKSILQQMLLPIFDNVPIKVMAIVTYYLVLLIILIILRG